MDGKAEAEADPPTHEEGLGPRMGEVEDLEPEGSVVAGTLVGAPRVGRVKVQEQAKVAADPVKGKLYTEGRGGPPLLLAYNPSLF